MTYLSSQRLSGSFKRLSCFDADGPGFVVEFCRHSAGHSRRGATDSRWRSLAVYPPELGLSITGLFLGGIVANGALRYALFGLAWFLVIIAFLEILNAIVALMVSGSAVVGFSGVDPEGFLMFIGLTLAGIAALVGVGAILVGGAVLLWEHRHRTPRPLASHSDGRPSIRPFPRTNHPAQGNGPRLGSLSQHIVSLAVRRLPTGMSDQERERWEEEMRGDVEVRFLLFQIIYALAILLRGAPAMPDGLEDAPQDKPSRG
jgi:hypothetical protein